MVHRQIGKILVRVDNLELEDEKMLRSSIHLVENINNHKGDAFFFGLLGCLLLFFAAIIFALAMNISDQMMNIIIPASFVMCVAIGLLVWLSVSHSTRKKTHSDINQISNFMAESEKCREFMNVYCWEYPDFARIMERHTIVAQQHST